MTVTADGRGVVLPAGSRLLADVADRATLTGELSRALVGLVGRGRCTIRGQVLVDLAVAVATAADADSASGSTGAGPGHNSSPPRSHAAPLYLSRTADPRPRLPEQENPATEAG
jgi:hypothetical protein